MILLYDHEFICAAHIKRLHFRRLAERCSILRAVTSQAKPARESTFCNMLTKINMFHATQILDRL